MCFYAELRSGFMIIVSTQHKDHELIKFFFIKKDFRTGPLINIYRHTFLGTISANDKAGSRQMPACVIIFVGGRPNETASVYRLVIHAVILDSQPSQLTNRVGLLKMPITENGY